PTILLPTGQALLSLVVPARTRGMGLALATVAIIPDYLIFVISGAIGDHFGLRGGVLVLVPVFLIGAAILLSAGSTVAADIRASSAAAIAAHTSRDAKKQGQTKLLISRDLD